LLIGWVLAHVVRADRPTRVWCLVASLAPDVDGLGLVLGTRLYEAFHHVLAHNFLFGVGLVALSARWVGVRLVPLIAVFAAFVLHLVGDYYGSGYGWALWPLWPLSSFEIMNPTAWPFVSWQNNVIGVTFLATTVGIAIWPGRTPLESVHPQIDRAVVDALQLRVWRAACASCEGRASARCAGCRAALCPRHAAGGTLAPRCSDCRPGG
jgi:membrane-bound metal-dependent hydrolase YbcI (DUF457 family)